MKFSNSNFQFSISKRGVALIELLVVLGVLMIVVIFSVAAFYTLTQKTDLDTSRDNIISILNFARNKTLASEEAAQYGIYFDTSSTPDRYVLFQGSNYATRNVSLDKIYNLPSRIEISSVGLEGTNETVFNRLKGDTNNYGSITIRSLKDNETRTVYIYSSGKISIQPESASGVGRVSDSRHIHFDLGWSINGATTLKFDFINSGEVKQIIMTDYFTLTNFDWEGEFSVNGTQKFRVHTHQLDSTTQLCIHRDRNEGKNAEEVYIYIVKNEVENYIVHYDDDQYATPHKGDGVLGEMISQ